MIRWIPDEDSDLYLDAYDSSNYIGFICRPAGSELFTRFYVGFRLGTDVLPHPMTEQEAKDFFTAQYVAMKLEG